MSGAVRSKERSTSGCAGGKFLTFALGKESYGLGILQVREILRLPQITHVPRLPAAFKGVMNMRGKVVPVVDLRAKLGFAQEVEGERACVIVVELAARGKALMGLLVDSVEEVSQIPAADIEPAPDVGLCWSADFILGMAKVKGVVKTLLDIDKLICDETLRGLGAAEAKTASA